MFTTKSGRLLWILPLLASILGSHPNLFGQTERVLYTFTGGNDGSRPFGSLVADSAGSLYGATAEGGTGSGGVVFKLTRSGGGWVETVLHDFAGGSDGFEPLSPLVLDAAGNVYGATAYGGTAAGGTIFEISPSGDGWTETVLFSLGESGATDPIAGLAADAAGNLFGTTSTSSTGFGAVFELSPSTGGGWSFSILHIFAGSKDGAYPYGTVILDPSGNLYGTTELGGLDWGTVYEITRTSSGWNHSVIYGFRAGKDGEAPFGNLTFSPTGHLYGTTIEGGTAGQGTAFELTPSPSGKWSERVIHSFGTYVGDSLGPAGSLVMDGRGNLYGATAWGGAFNNGAVFELRPTGTNWHEKLLYSFLRPSEGDAREIDNVILDSVGDLYGVATSIGAKSSGIVFEVVP